MNESKLGKKFYIFIGIISLLLLFLIIFILYVSDYYHADLDSISVISYSDDINKEVLSDNTIVYSKEDATTGIIFYPGGKVEYLAYEPLIIECSKYGYLCAIVEMPFNLAVFDIDRANSVMEKYPEVENWYVGGHSLGGAMAASYVGSNTSKVSGLILLGAYSTSDLSNTSLNVISIYGSEDKVLNKEKYNNYKSNLPKSYKEEIITGGCHSYFGMYGHQSGDGKCLIKNSDQISKTMEIISKYIVR